MEKMMEKELKDKFKKLNREQAVILKKMEERIDFLEKMKTQREELNVII